VLRMNGKVSKFMARMQDAEKAIGEGLLSLESIVRLY